MEGMITPLSEGVRWKEGEVLLDKEKSMVVKMAMWFRRYQRDIYSSPKEAFWISFTNPEHGIQVLLLYIGIEYWLQTVRLM